MCQWVASAKPAARGEVPGDQGQTSPAVPSAREPAEAEGRKQSLTVLHLCTARVVLFSHGKQSCPPGW